MSARADVSWSSRPALNALASAPAKACPRCWSPRSMLALVAKTPKTFATPSAIAKPVRIDRALRRFIPRHATECRPRTSGA